MAWTLTITDDRALRALKDFRGRALRAVRRTMNEQTQLIASTTVVKRLSFPKSGPSTGEGLRVQTNRLRSSVGAWPKENPAEILGDAVVSSLGSNVRYAGVHEHGFTGFVSVPAHTRTVTRRLKILNKQKALPVFIPPTTPRRKGESDKAFFHRAAQRERHARAAFETKLRTAQYGNTLFTERRVRGGQASVRAHSRLVNLPARQYLSSSIEEHWPAFTQAVEAALVKTFEDGTR